MQFHANSLDKVVDRLYIGDLQASLEAKKLKSLVNHVMLNIYRESLTF
jgi:hypothetical protein